jgi:dienelactone hydrolase
MRSRRTWIAIVAAAALVSAYATTEDYVDGAAFVIQAAGMQGFARTAAEWTTEGVAERPARIPWRGGELEGRWYVPQSSRDRPVLLVPGVHAAGIDEPRLTGFARDLASMGHTVLTAELPDLIRYSVTPRATDMIEDAAAWLARQPDVAADGRVGLMGISFAGGLSIVAAGRTSIRDKAAYVMSFGGHGDLPRTLRYLCTGVQPDGALRPPHDYGVAIILLGVAERVVPAEQVAPLRSAILAFLEASHVDMIDKARGQDAFAHARQLAGDLPEPARTLVINVNNRDVARLGPMLLPHVSELGGDPSLSPSRSAAPAAAVYLLHGTDDNVIPAVESVLLARELRERHARVRQLATPLITHAEVDRAKTFRTIWELVRFWGDLLDE